jgi:GxxExxY protein
VPIQCPVLTKRVSQAEFKLIASEVVGHVIAIHNDFGRFFDELIYKNELAARMNGVVLEVEVSVTHGSFAKSYYADVLVNSSGLFEFKAADAIHTRHRGQTLNYLLLLDLAHGKILNVRPESLGQEFVNCPTRLCDLKHPTIVEQKWSPQIPGASELRDLVMALISDWGSGLETSLYEDAITHFLGGESSVLLPVPVMGKNGTLGDQRMRLAAPGVAFKITALRDRLDEFENQASRFLRHTALTAIHWVNITQSTVSFTTLSQPMSHGRK